MNIGEREAAVELEYELTPGERTEIRNKYPKTYFPQPTLEPLYFGRRDKVRIEGKRAIIDQNPCGQADYFGICSDAYKIIYYEDIIHMVENSVGALTDYGKIQICPTTFCDGGRLAINIKFPDIPAEIKKVDAIIPKVTVYSSYDLSTKLTGKFGAFQLKCTNGMGIWKSMVQFAKRHLQNLFLNNLGETISAGMGIFGEQINSWKKWTELPIDKDTYDHLWEVLPFSPAEKIKIEQLSEIGTGMVLPHALKTNSLDLWGLNSVLTQFATHEVKSELRRIDLETDIAKAMEMTYINRRG